MNHFTSPKYWKYYSKLSNKVQKLSDKSFQLLKQNPKHPSLHFKKIKEYWTVRIGISYRAVGISTPDNTGIIWFWIGNHNKYEVLLKEL